MNCGKCEHFGACARFWLSDYDSTKSIEETKEKHQYDPACVEFRPTVLNEYGVMTSIQPRWCELIAQKKRAEVRKSCPKIKVPFRGFIYCTHPKGKYDFGLCLDEGRIGLLSKSNYPVADSYGLTILSGKVIGEYVCNEITYLGNIATDPWALLVGDTHEQLKRLVVDKACLTEDQLHAYGGKYLWHLSDVVIYSEPKTLKDFGLFDAPQSWCYVQTQK